MVNEELTEWKILQDNIQAQTDGGYAISEPFPDANRTALTWVRWLTVTNPADYTAVEQLLDNTQLFDIVIAQDDQQIINGTVTEASSTPPPGVDADLPDCGTPYEPNDPDYFLQDHLANLQMPCAFSITTGSPDITVGIVDFYFDINNTELAGKWKNNPGFSPSVINGLYAGPTSRHGTAMAGGIAAGLDNGLCVAGTGGNTTVRGYASGGILTNIHDAVSDGNPIISVSVQNSYFTNPSFETRELVRNVFEDAVERGSAVTFAVNADNAIHLLNISGVMLVGYGWETGAYKPYRRGGIDDVGIEFILPANQAVTMNGPNDCATNVGGSSLGAAYLAGISALLLDVNNCLTPTDIEHIIYNTSEDVNNRDCCFPTYFTEGKGRVNAYQAVLGAQNYTGPPKLTVVSGETKIIDGEENVYNDILVETGGVLEVNGSSIAIEGNTYGPYQNGRIVVERGAKLIARNSRFTSSSTNNACVSKRWSGIRVHGNIDLPQPNMYDAGGILQVNTPLSANEAGVVILIEGSIVENAENAVATSVPGYSYQDQVDRWGGLIIADHVTFRNNFRAAEFLQYPRANSGNTFVNKSSFNDCFFVTEDPDDDRTLGITLWGTDNIRVTRSTFKNLGRESVLTVDGSYIVEDGNTFINDNERFNHRHLSAMSTYPYGAATRIGSDDIGLAANRFYTQDRADVFVFSEGTSNRAGLEVIDNEFYFTGPANNQNSAPGGIEIVGPHVYRIKGNEFNVSSRPIILDNTGIDGFSRQNRITCNYFFDLNGPLQLENNNLGTQLLQNKFAGSPNSGSVFANLWFRGESDPQQGSGSNPANNEFSNSNVQRDISVSTGASFFSYVYSDNGSSGTNIFEPRGPVSGYNSVTSTFLPTNLCAQGIPPGIQGDNTPDDIATVHAALSELEVYLTYYPDDTAKIIEHQELATERDQRVNKYVSKTVGRGEVDSAVAVLSILNSAAAEMRSFGVYMGAGRYSDASQKLPVINSYGSEYGEFVYVQNINIDRLTDTVEYVLSTVDKNELTQIAGGDSRFRGYSRALLVLLEDERYYDVWDGYKPPSKPKSAALAKSAENDESKMRQVSVFPNPSTGVFNITGKELDNVAEIDVYDAIGKKVTSIVVAGRTTISIDLSEHAGLLSLLFRGSEDTFSRKVIIK